MSTSATVSVLPTSRPVWLERAPPVAVNRAYSVLTVKTVDAEQRIIEGIATTPTVDRVGDIVEPMGAKFALPMPLLWQHRHDEPVGQVEVAKATKQGISIRAKIAKIAEPGPLKDTVDRAWQAVKAGLVRGLSIGFKPLDFEALSDGSGLRYRTWDFLELSLVTVPAQSEATINVIKRIDQGGRSALPEVMPDDLVGAIRRYVDSRIFPLKAKLSAQEAESAALKEVAKRDLALAIDQAGVLVQARSDGSMRDLGVVVGRDGVDGKDGRDGIDGPLGRDGVDGIDGPPGRDGIDGKDGRDGITFEDFQPSMEYDGIRTFTFKISSKGKSVEWPFQVPGMIYREIWKEGVEYQAGDTVTRGGSMWVALKATKVKPDDPNSRDWRMATKHGRDGRDGKSAYQVAVDAGFKGSETEWLKSLRDVKIPTVKVG